MKLDRHCQKCQAEAMRSVVVAGRNLAWCDECNPDWGVHHCEVQAMAREALYPSDDRNASEGL